MRRDALGDVMDALDHFACATCGGRGTAPEGFQWPEPMCRECMGARWRSDLSPAEAVEALATARLWPWEIGDERAPRWWCEFLNDAIIDDPPSHAALVAVASLGRPLLQRITHTLVPWIARAAGCPDARVVWRPMTREAINAWAMERRGKTCRSTADLVVAMSTEGVLNPSYLALPHAMSWAPASRALAVGDGETPQPTGVHLVGLDTSRIVLAVEAI